MSKSIAIDKDKELATAADFQALRELGVGYIQELADQLWTDHNLHDPGINTLEILCYALTDLAFRTGFDTKDLLTTEAGQVTDPQISSFFPAHEILTNTPLTLLDYRKLLLKIEGVKNAWFDPQMVGTADNEIPIYADCLQDALSFEPLNGAAQKNLPVYLSGLYKVLIELDKDDVLGSFNDAALLYLVNQGALKGVQLAIDSSDIAFIDGELPLELDFVQVDSVNLVQEDDGKFIYKVDLALSGNTQFVFDALIVRVIDDSKKASSDAIVEAGVQNLLATNGNKNPLALFWQKQQKIQQSLHKICCVLQAHRNLCEDYLSIEVVKAEQIAICADIELTPDADLEAVQAAVFFTIEQYLNPPVNYYSLQELLAADWCSTDIFNGPYINTEFLCDGQKALTKPGFIKNKELLASELRKVVYTSDIINVLMDLESVVAIRNVQLRKYDSDGNALGVSENWCLAISDNHQPNLNFGFSKVLFFKNKIPYLAQYREFEKTIEHLRAMARKAAYVSADQTLKLPLGDHRDTGQHFTVQNDFPETYGIGEVGLPATAKPARVVQAQQFKGYLTLFDQMLADYLAQLNNFANLFSLDPTVKQTYFSQFLDTIPGVSDLFEDEFYLDKAHLQNNTTRTLLTEDEVLYHDRKNRLLDHLIARFSEQFTDYVLMMYSITDDQLKADSELIEDKVTFLQEYPVISRERNKAFNYLPELPADIWDTENVSGLQKRVSRLTGLDNYNRRDLSCAKLVDGLFSTRKVGGQFRSEIKDDVNNVLFKSQETFANADLALAEGEKLFLHLHKVSSYMVDSSGGAGAIFYTINAGGASLQQDKVFDTKADAYADIRVILDRYDELLESDLCNNEGFFLFEHILLRPFVDQDRLMTVCLQGCDDGECFNCGDADPYSFRVSVVLPYWPTRFQKLEFRRYFEKLVREQAPAHIQCKICWVSHVQMIELEQAYQAWLAVKANKDFDQLELSQTLATLIEILEQLKTVYPVAVLNDCADDGDGPVVTLGSTNLGTF